MKSTRSLILAGLMAAPLAAEMPLIVDDLAIIASFEDEAAVWAEDEEVPRLEEVLATLKKPVGLDALQVGQAPERVEDAIYSISAVYDCGKCDKWHAAGFATAWAIGQDGVFCTNYHVFAGMKGEMAAVVSVTGEVYPITEVLLADKLNDIAIFRARAEGISTLPIVKEPEPVGAPVYCVSHPDRRFYTHTYGEISRYYFKRTNKRKAPKVPFMAITADYARGSSGGPILNSHNEVVGIVSNTSGIKYGKKGQRGEDVLQMVIKNCIPAFKIQELLSSGAESESSQEAAETS
ncbi:MAG: serine protease [Verrucomicrobiota bacterium JB023]|nr:serine protease [Verrucomicrobiota bacterium JB023]